MAVAGVARVAKIRRLIGSGGARSLFLYTLYQLHLRDLKQIGARSRRSGTRARVGGVTVEMTSPLIDDAARGFLLTGLYEAPERELIWKHVPTTLPVIELGASIGVVSCILNRRLAAPHQQVVVEAHPGLIPLLERQRQLNGCAFRIVNAAIGYEGEELLLFGNNGSLVGSAHRTGGEPLRVPTTTLERLAAEAGFEQFTLVCDIEGSEIDLIDHELELLQRRVRWIVMELHPSISGQDEVERVVQALRQAGFKLVEQDWAAYCFENTALAGGIETSVPGSSPTYF